MSNLLGKNHSFSLNQTGFSEFKPISPGPNEQKFIDDKNKIGNNRNQDDGAEYDQDLKRLAQDEDQKQE